MSAVSDLMSDWHQILPLQLWGISLCNFGKRFCNFFQKVLAKNTQAEKRKEKLVKQLKETKEYDEKIAHLALSRIDIDLDDGVKVNYEKVQTGQDGKKLDILGKI